MEQIHPPRILVADDDETLCEVLATALEIAGYATHQATTLEAVFSALSAERFGLVLIDTMHASRGEASNQALAAVCEQAGAIPVLVMTGSKEVAAWVANALPIAGVLEKPFDLEPFLQRVADLCDRSRRSPQTWQSNSEGGPSVYAE
jgi:DNA-binding NtrC family response regulator